MIKKKIGGYSWARMSALVAVWVELCVPEPQAVCTPMEDRSKLQSEAVSQPENGHQILVSPCTMATSIPDPGVMQADS